MLNLKMMKYDKIIYWKIHKAFLFIENFKMSRKGAGCVMKFMFDV